LGIVFLHGCTSQNGESKKLNPAHQEPGPNVSQSRWFTLSIATTSRIALPGVALTRLAGGALAGLLLAGVLTWVGFSGVILAAPTRIALAGIPLTGIILAWLTALAWPLWLTGIAFAARIALFLIVLHFSLPLRF
jgi:hypothetical protein